MLDVGRQEYWREFEGGSWRSWHALRASPPNNKTQNTNKPTKMNNTKTSGSILLALGLLPLSAAAGTWSFTPLYSDADTGLDPSLIYTHLVDFGADATAATINGVQFTAKAASGPTYTFLHDPGGSFQNNVTGDWANQPNSAGLADLFGDFFFAGVTEGGTPGIQRLTLTGLKEAHTYRLSFPVSGWGLAFQVYTASDDTNQPSPQIARNGEGWIPDPANDMTVVTTSYGRGALINYEFVAPEDGTFVLTLRSINPGDSFHCYGFWCEQIALPADTDGDGIPDVWENKNGLNPNVNDANGDLDSDGLKNIDEYLANTKANNPDTDADGYKDGVETKTGTWVSASNTGTDPLNPDTDGDGLKDGVETNTGVFVNATNTGTNPLKADTDADGFSDGVEVQQGFNPTSAASTPESDMSIRTAIEFRFNAASGQRYRIEGSADLQSWATVEDNIIGAGVRVTRFYSTENTPIRFYRWVKY
jgi:hypothetical protein